MDNTEETPHLSDYARAIMMCEKNVELMKGWDGKPDTLDAWAKATFPDCNLSRRQARSLRYKGSDSAANIRRMGQRRSEQTT